MPLFGVHRSGGGALPGAPLVGNQLTAEAVVWSTLSIIALLGGIGLMLTAFGRYSHLLGWHAEEERRLRFLPPEEVPLTPAQRSTSWYFMTVAALFLVQTLLGGATAHYHAETGSFFGIDLPQWLPYNLTRTWHLQLAIFFVSAAYLAAGIFLAPLIAGYEPPGQRLLSFLLLGAVVVVESTAQSPLVWQSLPAGTQGFVDFGALFSNAEHISAYVFLRVYSSRKQKLSLLCGSDDFIRVWLIPRELFVAAAYADRKWPSKGVEYHAGLPLPQD